MAYLWTHDVVFRICREAHRKTKEMEWWAVGESRRGETMGDRGEGGWGGGNGEWGGDGWG